MRKPKYKAGDNLFFFPKGDFNPYPQFYGAKAVITGYRIFYGWVYYIGTLFANGKKENFYTFSEEHFAEKEFFDVEIF